MLSNFLIKKFIKNNDDINDNKVRIAYGNLGGTVGIIINTLLFLIKLFVGLFAGSIAIIADAFEAILGAIYLDGGYEIARDIALELLSKEIDQTLKGHNVNEDYKTKLQEILQRNGNVKIEYVLLKEYGPEHDKTFEVEVLFNGKKIGEGIGKSKKQAEQNCAKQAIEQLSRN